MKTKYFFFWLGFFAYAKQAEAESRASLPYTPSWSVRHQLQLLVDLADLPLVTSQWPLPAAAVEQALQVLPANLSTLFGIDLQAAREAVQGELFERTKQSHFTLQLRNRAEGLTGFDDNYTPGSAFIAATGDRRIDGDEFSFVGRTGVRLEQSSYSLRPGRSGLGPDNQYQMRLEGTAAVVAWAGWNLQAFSHRNWWGPGWQSSLVNGTNSPAWIGIGLQRGTVQRSVSPWLEWAGPWNFDFFVARAQDPLVVPDQPQGFLFSGMRLTIKPRSWMEFGFSRVLQTGGSGRQTGVSTLVKSLIGQNVNQEPGDPPDSSSQIAGYDLRVRCPLSWGQCAAYTQWMGEDAAGSIPLPYKFMSLWGLERSYGYGRHRVFVEYVDTNAFSLPWDRNPKFPGYINGIYTQGFTNGGRWIGAAQGGGSQVISLGWMDAQNSRRLRFHSGKVLYGVGAGYPGVNAPNGQLHGLSASQSLAWRGLVWTPEVSWTQLSDGQDLGASKLKNLRLGINVRVPL